MPSFFSDATASLDVSFITSATAIVTPVVKIDGKTIGDGRPGPIAARLRRDFYRYAERAPALSMPPNLAKSRRQSKIGR